MRRSRPPGRVAALLLAIVSGTSRATGAQATPLDGSFESGAFGSWGATGDALVMVLPTLADFPSPTDGAAYAVITTINPYPSYETPLSGQPAVSAASLETLFGLAAGTLAADWIYEGSGILSSPFAATSGDVLRFDVDFLSDDSIDRAFYVLTNGSTASVVPLFDAADLIADSNTGIFAQETLFRTVSAVVPESGTWSLGFGVADRGDTQGSSALIIDNVRQVPVPQPGSASLLGLGLSILAARRRRRRATSPACGEASTGAVRRRR